MSSEKMQRRGDTEELATTGGNQLALEIPSEAGHGTPNSSQDQAYATPIVNKGPNATDEDGEGNPRASSTALQTSRRALLPDKKGTASAPLRELPGYKLYQDELYGSKELTPLAVTIINSPEFQRLGEILQLGYTDKVFRGANHRRFDHCVGAYFISRMLLRRIVQNHRRIPRLSHPGSRLSPRLAIGNPSSQHADRHASVEARWSGLTEVVSAAALLHDVGHVAFGHTLEDEFPNLYDKHDGLGGYRLFTLLYGPRSPRIAELPESVAVGVEKRFGPLNEAFTPPEPGGLVSLPWVFEEGFYPNLLGNGARISNPLLRDLIYLILSFKESPSDDSTFSDELEKRLNEIDTVTRQLLLERSRRQGGEDGAHLATKAPAKLRNFTEAELDEALRKAKLEQACTLFVQDLWDAYGKDSPKDDKRALYHPFMSDVISNTICADLWDYSLRDGRRLDFEPRQHTRLQRYIILKDESGVLELSRDDTAADYSRLRVVIHALTREGMSRRDTVSELMSLMRERYHFAEAVYYHPKKAAFSTMLAAAVELLPTAARPRDDVGVYEGAPWLGSPKTSKPPHVAHLADTSFEDYVRRSAEDGGNVESADLIRRARYRGEYPLLFTVDYRSAQATGGVDQFVRTLRDGEKAQEARLSIQRDLRDLLCEYLGQSRLTDMWPGRVPEYPVLIYIPGRRMQAKEVDARVELTPGLIVPLSKQLDQNLFSEELRLLNRSYQELWRLYLFCHPAIFSREVDPVESLPSLLIDRFSAAFSIREMDRRRGARRLYQSPKERLLAAFARLVPKDGQVDQQIWNSRLLPWLQSVLVEERFWLMRSGHLAMPVADEDYLWGFQVAALFAAADEVEDTDRAPWPAPIRPLRGRAWFLPSASPSEEDARQEACRKVLDASLHFGHRKAARMGDLVGEVKRLFHE